jgi:hypothetical protein
MHALAAQPSPVQGGGYVTSSLNSIADLLRLHVAPLHAAPGLMFKAKNMATELRCGVKMRDEQKSFKIAAALCSVASTPGASPAVVLECAKAIACTVGSRPDDARSQRLLHDLCNLPALEEKSAIRACALEILSSRSAPLSVHLPPLQQRVHRIQAACVLCAVKQYPLQQLAQEMQAGWAHDSPHRAPLSSLRLQVSVMCAFVNLCVVL